ncbi:MAG: response regulator [Clostridiales bacterium]|nr:response regulator [Clostridiales bacterium]
MKKVLIVDDTKNIRILLTKCLELEGYEVSSASDGRLAMELLEKETYDLVFLDIKLPEIRGTEVLKRMREQGLTTPVIIITAYATVKNAVECTGMGAVAYVQKPFSADKIRTVLKEIENNPVCGDITGQNVERLLEDARSYLSRGMYEKALEASKKALSIDINDPEIYLQISRAYEGMGSGQNAERFYQFYKSSKNDLNNI